MSKPYTTPEELLRCFTGLGGPVEGKRSRCKPDLSERCASLESMLSPRVNDRRTGLALATTAYGGGPERISGVVLRRTDRGTTHAIQLNLCPFCGVGLTGAPRWGDEKAPTPTPSPEPPDWSAA